MRGDAACCTWTDGGAAGESILNGRTHGESRCQTSDRDEIGPKEAAASTWDDGSVRDTRLAGNHVNARQNCRIT